jgi:hypothetical protein
MRMDHKRAVLLAEIAFLLIVISGVWFVASEIPAFGISEERKIVSGVALAIAGLLLIIATYSGKLFDG